MIFEGCAHRFGANIDTDLIIPGRYLHLTDMNELKQYIFKDLDESLFDRINKGDILVCGENFGCGSSREQAPRVIKACGVSAVIASSFARIFFRNAVNIGLPVFTCKASYDTVRDGDRVKIDTQEGKIVDMTQSEEWNIIPYPQFITDLIKCGGLIEFAKRL